MADDLGGLATWSSPYQLWQLGEKFWYEISRSSVEPDIFVVVCGVHIIKESLEEHMIHSAMKRGRMGVYCRQPGRH